jgi:hypothetical protein
MILKVALQYALFDKHRVLRWITFIVNIQGTAPKRDCSIIDNGTEFGSYGLSDET